MKKPKMIRQRYIPYESRELCDPILMCEDNQILTSWLPFSKRSDMSFALSLYLMDNNWKISIICDENGDTLRYYCDIIATDYYMDTDTYIFRDLLADIIIYPDGTFNVVDLDELGDALTQGLITKDEASLALHAAQALISAVRDKSIAPYLKMLEEKKLEVMGEYVKK